MGNVLSLPHALFRPDRAFAESAVFGIPKSLLVILIFLLCVVGQRLSIDFTSSAHGKELQLLEGETRLSTLMGSAPPEAQANARDAMVGSVLGKQSGLISAIGVAESAVVSLLLCLEMWLVGMVVSQFFGGQEDRRGRDRHSLTLFLVAFIPIALRRLVAGIVLAMKDPDAAANALTYKDYLAVGAPRFDLVSLIGVHGLPGFLSALAAVLTNPFSLWTFAIVTFGARHVYRMSFRGALGLSAVLVLILSLQAALLASVGVTMEI